MHGIISIDLGGTWMRAALVTPDGKCARFTRQPTRRDRPATEIAGELASIIRKLAAPARGAGSVPAAVTIGVPTTLDRQGGLAPCDNLPTLSGFRLGREIETATELPVRLFNDADCFTAGEWRLGVGRGMKNFCGITLGTGIGLGLVIEGRIYHGSHGCAGEIWKTPLESGMLEDRVCGRALVREYANRSGRRLEGDALARRARAGDPRAKAVFNTFGAALGRIVAFIVNVLDPEAVAFGGSVAHSWRLFQAPLVRAVVAGTVAGNRVILKKTALGAKAALLGAAQLYRLTKCN